MSIEEWHQCIKRYPGGLKDLMQLYKMANLYTGLLQLAQVRLDYIIQKSRWHTNIISRGWAQL